MPHVSIQHIIGTVALIGLVVSLALAYQIIVSSVESSVIKTQLSQAAEYVSMSLANIISLTDFTYGILDTSLTPVVKRLDLPKTIGGKPYNLTIVKDDKYYVYIEIIGKSYLHSTSPIAVSTQRVVILTGGDMEYAEDLLRGSGVSPRAWVCGGSSNAVIWCYKYNNIVYAGLGALEGG